MRELRRLSGDAGAATAERRSGLRRLSCDLGCVSCDRRCVSCDRRCLSCDGERGDAFLGIHNLNCNLSRCSEQSNETMRTMHQSLSARSSNLDL
nr:hypothetical protein CFP56_39712 [Quercus suber]